MFFEHFLCDTVELDHILVTEQSQCNLCHAETQELFFFFILSYTLTCNRYFWNNNRSSRKWKPLLKVCMQSHVEQTGSMASGSTEKLNVKRWEWTRQRRVGKHRKLCVSTQRPGPSARPCSHQRSRSKTQTRDKRFLLTVFPGPQRCQPVLGEECRHFLFLVSPQLFDSSAGGHGWPLPWPHLPFGTCLTSSVAMFLSVF